MMTTSERADALYVMQCKPIMLYRCVLTATGSVQAYSCKHAPVGQLSLLSTAGAFVAERVACA